MVKVNNIMTGGAKLLKQATGKASGKAATDQNLIGKYIFIICLLCCILPGIYQTFTQDIDDINEIIACTFEDAGDAVNPQVRNKTVTKNIQEIFKNSSDTSENIVKNAQVVTIAPSDDYDESSMRYDRSMNCPASGIRGLIGFTDQQPAFGCSYDIDQSMDIEFTKLDEKIVEESEEIHSMVMSNLIAEVSGGAGKEADKDAKAEFLNSIEEETKKIVTDMLQKVQKNSVDQLQAANVINFSSPIRCACGENPNPTIDQGIQLEILAESVDSAVRDFVSEKALENNLDLELEGVGNDTGKHITCALQILACTASILGIIGIIYQVLQTPTAKGASGSEMLAADSSRLSDLRSMSYAGIRAAAEGQGEAAAKVAVAKGQRKAEIAAKGGIKGLGSKIAGK